MLPRLGRLAGIAATTAATSVQTLALTAALGTAAVATAPVARAYAPPEGYADLVEQVTPAVVFIEVKGKDPRQPAGRAPGFRMPPGLELPPGFPPVPGLPSHPPQPTTGVGSGYIISPDGEIVTNNHVIDGAGTITVRLEDGRRFKARVLGTDPLTDIALLKIEDGSVKDLPTVRFADSGRLRVGDAVIAVGNPFGLGGTVTAGIISALGRDIDAGPYDSYIQTDAAINRGNSGGPLFNTKGEVVGMNTAIFSPSGGSVGIGFSIPSDTIRKVVSELRENGTVTRGWLGVRIQEITPEIAEALGLEAPEGALVSGVRPDGPARQAGLRAGDVILEVGGERVKTMQELPSLVAALDPGETVRFVILRDGRKIERDVTIGTLSPEKQAMPPRGSGGSGLSPSKLGIEVEPLTPELAARHGLPPDAAGVVVISVDPQGPNAEALRPGDVIEAVNNAPVQTPGELAAALKQAGDRPAVLLRIIRQGMPLYVGARLPAA